MFLQIAPASREQTPFHALARNRPHKGLFRIHQVDDKDLIGAKKLLCTRQGQWLTEASNLVNRVRCANLAISQFLPH